MHSNVSTMLELQTEQNQLNLIFILNKKNIFRKHEWWMSNMSKLNIFPLKSTLNKPKLTIIS